jgi:signal transduction histidine kinase
MGPGRRDHLKPVAAAGQREKGGDRDGQHIAGRLDGQGHLDLDVHPGPGGLRLPGRDDRRLRLGLQVEAELSPAQTTGDQQLIERMVWNLVDNAVRHNEPGGWIRVMTGTCGQGVLLRIANSGARVPDDAVPTLFEPFRRMEGNGRGDGGVGLGLSIAQSVSVAHGSELDVRSQPGGGLNISVVLPSPRPRPPRPSPGTPPGPAARRSGPPRGSVGP